MVTREVGRDRLVRALLSIRESCKRRSQQPFQLQIYYNLIHHNLTQLALVLSQRTNTLNEIIHKLYHTTNPHTYNQYVYTCHYIYKPVKEISQTTLMFKNKQTYTYNIEAIITTTAATRPSHHTNTTRQTTGQDTYRETHSVRWTWRYWEKQKNISIRKS